MGVSASFSHFVLPLFFPSPLCAAARLPLIAAADGRSYYAAYKAEGGTERRRGVMGL